MVSAIGLRQAFPMQTNKTLVRPSFLVIGRILSKFSSSRLRGLAPRIASGRPYSCSGRLQEPPYETHDIPVLYHVQSGKALIGSGGQLWRRAGTRASAGRYHVQIQTPDLPLFCVKANTVNPYVARDLAIHVVANR